MLSALQVLPEEEAADPLGATASTALIVQDASGRLAVTASVGPRAEIAGEVISADELGRSQSYRLSSKDLAAQEESPPQAPPLLADSRPSSAARGGGGSSSAGSLGDSPNSEVNTSGRGSYEADEAPEMRRALPLIQTALGGNISLPQPAAEPSTPREGASKRAASGSLASQPRCSGTEASLEGQELLPPASSRADVADGMAEEDDVAGSSPLGSSTDSSGRAGRSRGSPSRTWSPHADGEGSPIGGDRQGPGSGHWRELGGAVGKKYYEAFKSRNSLTYTQVRNSFCMLVKSQLPGLRSRDMYTAGHALLAI